MRTQLPRLGVSSAAPLSLPRLRTGQAAQCEYRQKCLEMLGIIPKCLAPLFSPSVARARCSTCDVSQQHRRPCRSTLHQWITTFYFILFPFRKRLKASGLRGQIGGPWRVEKQHAPLKLKNKTSLGLNATLQVPNRNDLQNKFQIPQVRGRDPLLSVFSTLPAGDLRVRQSFMLRLACACV